MDNEPDAFGALKAAGRIKSEGGKLVVSKDTHKIHDPFLNKTVEISNNLTDRLRGKYANGPTMPNGEPEFGWRQFETPPVQKEAADEIERLQSLVESLADDLQAQAARNEEHYQAAMAMSEKHRKLWVGACQECKCIRTALQGFMKISARPWMDGGVSWPEWDVAMSAAETAVGDGCP